MKKIIKLLFVTLVVSALGFLFAGCQTFDGESQMVTKDGVKVEKLLANDSFMVMKLGVDSQSQYDALKALGKKFPQDPNVLLVDALKSAINEGSADVSYEDDVLPVIGEMPRLMFGFRMIDPNEDPQVLAVIEVADKDKAGVLLEKLIANDTGSKEQYKNYTIYDSKDDDMYVAFYKDVLVMAPEKEVVTMALDLADSNGKDTLLNNADYQKGISTLKENSGFFFMNPSYVVSELSDVEKEEMENVESMKDYIEVIEGEMFAFSAEEDGIRLTMNVFGDEEKMKEMGFPMGDEMLPAYLYNQLPGDDLMLYAESSNLKVSLEMVEKMNNNIDEFKDVLKQIKAAIVLAGIDYDEELLPLLDKGYAISLYNSGNMIPEFGLFVDVSSNVDSAKKILALVDNGLKMMTKQIPPELEGVLTFESTSNGNNKMVIDVNKMPEEEKVGMPADIAMLQTEFNYGLKDNVLYMALYKDLTKGGFGVVSDNAEFKQAMSHIPGYDKGITFVDVTMVMKYVEGMVTEYTSAADDISDYEMFKQYMVPVKSMIMSANDFENGMVTGEAFVRIE